MKNNSSFFTLNSSFFCIFATANRRRDARVVEWTALEMRRTLTGTLGSNPSLSAKEGHPRGALFALLHSPQQRRQPNEAAFFLLYLA